MKLYKRVIALTSAGMLAVSSSAAAFADEPLPSSMNSIITALHGSDVRYYELETMTSYNDYNSRKEKFSANRDHTVGNAGLPSKFDLRNVDGKCYVSSVKNQAPWPTCWSFGAIAAAETSLAYSAGYDYNDKSSADAPLFDLSERHLAWFMYNALPEGNPIYPSQAGEGLYTLTDISALDAQGKSGAVFGTGGYMTTATTLFSAGMGPVLEKDVPYEGKNAELFDKIVTMYSFNVDDNGVIDQTTLNMLVSGQPMSEETLTQTIAQLEAAGLILITQADLPTLLGEGDPKYAGKTLFMYQAVTGNGDWTVDEEYRFNSEYSLVEGRLLANPAQAGENGEYLYDSNATDMIKNELVNGRAVTIAFKADQAAPGQQLSSNPMLNFLDENGQPTNDPANAKIWAQYTYDKAYDPSDPDSVNRKVFDINHAVCIVGYDDDFPKEYFNDPKGTLAGSGAWLVKNSWGSVNAEDPASEGSWGNGGDGYFWLSYYDQGICMPESFSFADNKEDAYTLTNVRNTYGHYKLLE